MTSEKRCQTCNRLMDTGSPSDTDCGGDCAWCMAYVFNDPDEMSVILEWNKAKRIEQHRAGGE